MVTKRMYFRVCSAVECGKELLILNQAQVEQHDATIKPWPGWGG